MADFLMREDAPLTPAEWAAIDEMVVNVARKQLVGRRFVPLAGPFGAGAQVVPVGAGDDRAFIPVTTIQHDFKLAWADVAHSRQYGTPLELAPAAMAAAACAQAEDKMIFAGLMKAKGVLKEKLGDWGTVGQAFADVVRVTGRLVEAGAYGPYAVVLPPAQYALLHRVYGEVGQLEIAMIREAATGGVFQSPALAPDQALVVSVEPQNFDLAVAQDLVTAYLGPDGLDHAFRVFEKLALRVKRPAAICWLTR